MPIDIDEFERAEDDFFRGGSELQLESVLKFLAYNPHKAYSRQEIQSSLGLSWVELMASLSRLEKQGRVRHKGQFWTVSEDFDPEEEFEGDLEQPSSR
jgi:predicted Rossmann fold nucleotide-binding protein DprA/Smf involved in DNA uptake